MQKREGRDYIFHMPHTSTFRAWGDQLCTGILHSYTLVPEHGYVCYKDRAKIEKRNGEIVPYNAGVLQPDAFLRDACRCV